MALRIVAVADTHTFQSDLRAVPDGDVFVHAGDICRAGTLAELEPFARWLQALPHKRKIIVPGNHDWCFVREPFAARSLLGDAITVLEDSSIEIDSLRFYGSPWQPAFHDWAYNLPRGKSLADKWSLIPDRTDVLITHGPPSGIGDRSSTGGRQGCGDLLERVRVVKPRLHMFGHIHEDGGAWQHEQTLFANVTTWECERGASVFDVSESGAVCVDIPSRK